MFTIDDASSRDLDDAISVHVDGTGATIQVAIANVARHVQKDGKLDVRAAQRVETRYYRRGNTPMLNRRIGDDLASLLPNQSRKVMLFTISLDRGV